MDKEREGKPWLFFLKCLLAAYILTGALRRKRHAGRHAWVISEKIHEICLNMKKTFYKQEIYDILRWYEA